MKSLSLFTLLLCVSTSLGENEKMQIQDFASVDDVVRHFHDRELCFIGKLEKYTRSDGSQVVNTEREFARGMEFEVLWNAGNRRESYWMHICGAPTFGDIYGPTKVLYAVTTEGNTATLPGRLVTPKEKRSRNWPWFGCAGRYKFYPIEIQQTNDGNPG